MSYKIDECHWKSIEWERWRIITWHDSFTANVLSMNNWWDVELNSSLYRDLTLQFFCFSLGLEIFHVKSLNYAKVTHVIFDNFFYNSFHPSYDKKWFEDWIDGKIGISITNKNQFLLVTYERIEQSRVQKMLLIYSRHVYLLIHSIQFHPLHFHPAHTHHLHRHLTIISTTNLLT